MKIIIVRTDIDVNCKGRALSGIDSAMTSELYRKYSGVLRICANNYYSRFTFIDEKEQYIGTFKNMGELLAKRDFVGNVLVLTHEQWLDKQNPEWRTHPRYQYW